MRRSETHSRGYRPIFALVVAVLVGTAAHNVNASDQVKVHLAARLSLFELHRKAGRIAAAQAVLENLDRALSAAAPERAELASAYERLHQEADALRVWEGLHLNTGKRDPEILMRMAQLYGALGQAGAALDALRKAWGDSLSPAQRRLTSDRIVSLASDQGRLDELADSLEAKHRTGIFDGYDTSLLVRLYIKAKRPAAAIDVVEKYFTGNGAGQVLMLKEQARTYRLLHDSDGYRSTTRRLIELDPDNASEYLRALVLDRLADSDEGQIGSIRALLKELRVRGPADINLEFEAGVLALAGLNQEAFETYRRSTVLQPHKADNYLLLGDVLKSSHRIPEAIAQFQNLAERAESDSVQVAAIDGLLNTLLDQSTPEIDRSARGIVNWAQRHLLEDLVLNDDRYYRYQLLADVFAAGGDRQNQFSALENSLPLAGPVRLSVLRELVTMVTPDADPMVLAANSGKGRLKGAADWRVIYGRRLMALNEILPPEVHLNLAAAFLLRNSLAEAAHAFEVTKAVDHERNPRAQIARLYDSASLDSSALEEYRLALIANRGNVPIMVDMARVIERTPRRREANELYALALRTMLLRQPQQVQALAQTPSHRPLIITNLGIVPRDPDEEAPTTLEYKRYSGIATRGLLATWPTESSHASHRLAEFEQLYNEELNSVRALPAMEQQAFPRLDCLASTVERLAIASGEITVAARVSSKRDAALSSDSGDDIAEGPPIVSFSATAEPFAEALSQAERSHSFDVVLNLSLMNGDQGERLAAALGWSRAGATAEALRWAHDGRLDQRHLRLLARGIVQFFRESDWLVSGIFLQNSTVLDEIETLSGLSVFSSEELLEGLTGQTTASQPARGFDIDPRAVPWIVSRLTAEDWLTLMQRLAAEGKADRIGYAPFFWNALLRQPIDPAFADAAGDSVFKMLTGSEGVNGASADDGMSVLMQLLVADIDAANVSVAQRFIDRWRVRHHIEIDYFKPVALLSLGQTAAAAETYVDLIASARRLASQSAASASSSSELPLVALRNIFLPKYEPTLEAHFTELETRHGFDVRFARLKFDVLYRSLEPEDRPAKMFAFLTRALVLEPDNVSYLSLLAEHYQSTRNDVQSVDMLERWLLIDPGDNRVRSKLAAAYLAMDRPLDAQQVNDASALDLRPTDPFRQPAQNVVRAVRDAIASGHEEAMRRELRRWWQLGSALTEGNGNRGYSWMFDTPLVESELPYRRFRSPTMWAMQKAAVDNERTILSSLVRFEFSVTEFEDFLRSVPPAAENEIAPLYDLVARAYSQHGLVDQKLARLDKILQHERASLRDFTLWLTLIARRPGPLSAHAMRVLDQHRKRNSRLSPHALALIARVHAAGNQDLAMDVYRNLAVRSRAATSSGTANSTIPEPHGGPLNIDSLLTESGRYLDRAHQTRWLADLSRLVDPGENAPAANAEAYRLFLEKAAVETDTGSLDVAASPARMIARMNRLAIAGQSEQAWRHLPELLRASGSDQNGLMAQYLLSLGIFAAPQGDEWLAPLGEGVDAVALNVALGALGAFRNDAKSSADRWLVLVGIIGVRLHLAGDEVSAQASLREISAGLLLWPAPSAATIDFLLDVANCIGRRLELPAEQTLIDSMQLPIELSASVIEATARQDGIERALRMGEQIAVRTQNDALLAVLAGLADQAGHDARAAHWRAVRNSASRARQALAAE